MKVEGTYQGCDPIISGVSKQGNQWKKTEFEIITDSGRRASRKVFTAFNTTCDMLAAVPKGARVEVSFDFDSEDYLDKNGQKRYSHEIRCFGISIITAQQPQVQYQQPAPPTGQQPQYSVPQSAVNATYPQQDPNNDHLY
jgi:hypothetical protein